MRAADQSNSTVQWQVAIAVVVGLLATLLVPPVGAAAEDASVDVFALHSDPASEKMILLDFDGYISPDMGEDAVTPVWQAPMSNITYPPYDLDGDHTTFNATERDVIHRVWLLVSEAYAPWDVDVTTEEPASLEELQRDPVDPGADTTWGSRTLITNHTDTTVGSGGLGYGCDATCGGIAQGGAFGAPGPKFTSPSSLVLPYRYGTDFEADVRRIAETVIHEVAHNLGLGHDTTTLTTGVFKPVMCVNGISGCEVESRPLAPFTPDTYDELHEIAFGSVVEDFWRYGLLLRPDDHGDDAGSATPLAGPALAAEGIVSFENDQTVQDDQDWFSFTVADGDTLDLAVTPSPHSMMLDIEATLFDGDGLQVAYSNPTVVAIDRKTATGLDATFAGLSLPAGTYFLRVAGSGGVGYTSYGSIGSYTVSGTVASPVPCDPGTYSETGNQPCTPAPAGTFVATVGATSATPCSLGTFQPDQGATSCTRAPVGSYVDMIGAITPTPCPVGTTTAFVGATSVHDCQANAAPVADAGGPYTVDEGSHVPLDGSGSSDPDGDTLTHDWDLDGDGTFETSGATPVFSAAGRDGPDTQTVGVRVCDQHGECDTDVATVTIDNVAPTISSITAPIAPVAIDTPVDVSVPFTDPGTDDTHSCTIDWGDTTTPTDGIVTGYDCTGSHSYTSAGVYTLTVTVTDDDGGADNELFEYVVVYDPAGGFVTGGGWIDSPVGAYTADPDLTGKASFGFVAKYKKGATVPDGNTQFQFKAGDLNFHSGSYEWLVVAGADAKFKGVGTINGTGNYGFMITATDSGINGGGNLDAFRIKIWDIDNGDAVVYDNQIGESDDSTAATALGGGSIVIHTK